MSQTLVEQLFPQKYQTLCYNYIRWHQLLSRRGLHLKFYSAQSFNFIYRSVSRKWSKNLLLGQLQDQFINENLSLSMLLEPLDGYERLAQNTYPLTFSTASPILLQIIGPIARIVTVLNQQYSIIYQPMTNLIYIYIGLDIIKQKEIKNIAKNVHFSINSNEIEQNLIYMHQETLHILPLIKGIKFKLKIAFSLGLSKILINKKDKKNIILLDYINAFLYGLWYIIKIRGHTLSRF